MIAILAFLAYAVIVEPQLSADWTHVIARAVVYVFKQIITFIELVVS